MSESLSKGETPREFAKSKKRERERENLGERGREREFLVSILSYLRPMQGIGTGFTQGKCTSSTSKYVMYKNEDWGLEVKHN